MNKRLKLQNKRKILRIIIVALLLQGCISSLPHLPKSEDKVYYSDKPVVMFILDASSSMNKLEEGKKRIDIAKENIINTINKIDDSKFNTSLLVFKGSCKTYLLVSTNNRNKHNILNDIKYIRASGNTPLAEALKKSREVLKNIKKKMVILFSDGYETCGGNPIAEAEKFYREQGININFQIIGYDVDKNAKEMLQKISNISPTWKYYDAKNAKDIDLIINRILKEKNLAKEGWDGNTYTFQFASNSTHLTSEYIEKINIIYNFLKNNNDNIIITGYTDSKGTKKYNKWLSLQRANIVKNKLIELGIDKNRIKVLGMGENNPIATNNTKEGRSLNRRVTIKVIKKY